MGLSVKQAEVIHSPLWKQKRWHLPSWFPRVRNSSQSTDALGGHKTGTCGWGSLFLCHCTAFTAKMKIHLNVHYFRKQWCLTRNQTDTSAFQEQAVSVAWFVVGEKVIISTAAFLLSQHVMNGCYFPGERRGH